jgi:hypothetical protein
MPITIEIHQGGDRTAVWMLIATFCLFGAALAQVCMAIFQAVAANRQAQAADRQVQAAERAIEVSRQQISVMKDLENKRTMPYLKVTLESYSNDSAIPLEVRNQGAGPALRISCGRHDPGTLTLVESTLIALPELSLNVRDSLVVTVSKGLLTPVPLYQNSLMTSSGAA